MIVSIIVAASENNVIGKDNDLIWSLPDDMKFFKDKTKGHHILMGRKNYESIPHKFRPLPHRTNIILTRRELAEENGIRVVHSIEDGIEIGKKNGEEEFFIIGGGEVYKQSMDLCDKIYLTRVHANFEGDTFFPELGDDWRLDHEIYHDKDDRHEYAFTFQEYAKK